MNGVVASSRGLPLCRIAPTRLVRFASDEKKPPHPQAIYHNLAQLQFGPILKSKAKSRRAKQVTAADEAYSAGLQDDDEHYWMAQTSTRQRSPTARTGKPTKKSLSEESQPLMRVQRRGATGQPSVSRILQATMSPESRQALAAWEQRMTAELGPDGFQQYKEATFARGHRLHAWIENYLEGGTNRQRPAAEGMDQVTQRHIASISPVLERVGEVRALESAVAHSRLNYCGVIDCVAVLNDRLCLIDWKTSERAKPDLASLYDNPLQVAAYLGKDLYGRGFWVYSTQEQFQFSGGT